MTTWSRSGNANFEQFKHRVKLSSSQWTTINKNGERPGYDHGGPLHLVGDIFKEMKSNESFKAFSVERRATRTMFVPEIIVKDEPLPAHMITEQGIAALAQGPQYDMFISFDSKDEAALFKLSFSGGVVVGHGGIN